MMPTAVTSLGVVRSESDSAAAINLMRHVFAPNNIQHKNVCVCVCVCVCIYLSVCGIRVCVHELSRVSLAETSILCES